MNCNLKYVNELFAIDQTRKEEVEKKKKIPQKITGVTVHRIKLKGNLIRRHLITSLKPVIQYGVLETNKPGSI